MRQVPEATAWPDERHMHAAIIELPFPSLEHFGGSDIDVSGHLAPQNDPGRGRSRANLRTLSRN